MSAAGFLQIYAQASMREYALTGRPTTLGRAPDNDIVLDDALVSRHHARIEWLESRAHLTDLGSANGTVVNDSALSAGVPQPLGSGDSIQIGDVELTWTEEERVPAEPGEIAAASGSEAVPAELVRAQPARMLLTVHVPDGQHQYPIEKMALTLGRDPSSDIRIDHPVVSRRHAELEQGPHGIRIVDVGSANGLTFGGRQIAQRLLADGDQLWITDVVSLTYQIQLLPSEGKSPEEPAEPEATPPPRARDLEYEAAPLHATMMGAEPSVEGLRKVDLRNRTELTIGRGPENDLQLDYPTISRRHARIQRVGSGDQYVIEDLHSSNGTVVNDDWIAPGEPHRLYAGSTMRIGPIKFIFAPEAVQLVDESRDLQLDALHLKKRVRKGVNLLQDISLAIRPREFVAVVGVSGAGKSTLLNALAGIWPATDGAVLVNGTDLYRQYDAFRTELGYVPQDDIIHKELTAEKALDYAARLRLPGDVTASERQQAVTEELEALGLAERRKVRVGSLSGGQRKRVCIGVERLTRPGLFFLDEATSGLDPGTENQLMRLLRQLADEGQTILLVTHATKNVMLCDQVVFLAKGGNLAFYGPPAEALAYFGVTDFDEIYEKLQAERSPEEWAADYRHSAQYEQYLVRRLQDTYGELLDVRPEAQAGAATAAKVEVKPKRVSGLRQFAVLTSRYLNIIRSDRVNLLLLLLIAPVLGAMDLIAWPRDVFDPVTGDASRVMTMLFLSAIIPFLVGSLSSVREIVKEKAIYLRERTVNLRIIPYLSSKVVVGFLFALYHAGALLALKLIAVDLSHLDLAEIGLFYLLLVMAVMSGVMWGLLISALAPREEQAMLLVIIVVVVQMVFSGGILPLDQLGTAGEVLGDATSGKWTFEAMVDVTQVERGECEGPSLDECLLPGIQAYDTDAERQVVMSHLEDRFGAVLDGDALNSIVAQLAIMAVLFVLLYIVQKRKDVI
jgi:ABC-type multidrug transport system ATPase subunit/pSer/pThr/pTyr-binding forkhead associated (FHA) protein